MAYEFNDAGGVTDGAAESSLVIFALQKLNGEHGDWNVVGVQGDNAFSVIGGARVVPQLENLHLYHEVSVFDSGAQTYEYINCHPKTGLLRDAQSKA